MGKLRFRDRQLPIRYGVHLHQIFPGSHIHACYGFYLDASPKLHMLIGGAFWEVIRSSRGHIQSTDEFIAKRDIERWSLAGGGGSLGVWPGRVCLLSSSSGPLLPVCYALCHTILLWRQPTMD